VGNAHRWNSKLIHAISDSMKEYGEDYSYENTIDIMLDQLVSHERRMKASQSISAITTERRFNTLQVD